MLLADSPGCHAVPYPVQLPDWLPETVIEDMLTFFRPLLVQTLDFMMQKQVPHVPITSRVHRSQQSNSNISVGSTNAEVVSRPEMAQDFDEGLLA
jgi:hypothetical protein